MPFPRSLMQCLMLTFLGTLCCIAIPGAANPVAAWNHLMLDAIRTETTGPTLSTRNLAMLNLALFDAVNAISRKRPPRSPTAASPG